MLLAFVVSPSFGEDPADLVLRNGRFYPVSTPGSVEGSLAVSKGRIAYLGPDAGVEAFVGSRTRTIDLAGRTVTPGLIDAHSHLAGLGAALERVDLVGTTSYAEVIAEVRRAADSVPAGEWIQGRGWDQNDWDDKAFPHHGPLSAAVAEHPVWMTRVDGHAALLNARAMELLGVDDDIADPPGGRFERDDQGRPTGVLVDTAMGVVRGRVPSATADERRRQIVAGARHCLERGLTTVTDMGVGQTTYEAYRELRERGELPIRSALFLADDEALLSAWFQRGPEVDPEARLLVRGVKLYSDGALGSRGAALVEPYTDDPANNGLLITGGDHIASVCERALKAGFQVGIHAIGDRGALVTLDAIENCFGKPRPEARFRLEHAQVMRLADIERMGRLGVIASMQPTHATSDGPWAEERVGPRRIVGAYAWRKMLDAGARLALGSDFPVESADPRLGLYSAVAREFSEGRPPGGWYPEEILSGEEALRGFTLDAAYSVFLEDEVGSLEVGKRADLVVFAEDVVAAEPARIPQVAIDYTLVDGEIAFAREGAE